MLLFCVSAYLVAGLLFTALYWMSLAVARKHDENNTDLQIEITLEGGD